MHAAFLAMEYRNALRAFQGVLHLSDVYNAHVFCGMICMHQLGGARHALFHDLM